MKRNLQNLQKADKALLEAQSLMNLAQAALTCPEMEDIYNLLGTVSEKLTIAVDFINKNEDSLEKEART